MFLYCARRDERKRWAGHNGNSGEGGGFPIRSCANEILEGERSTRRRHTKLLIAAAKRFVVAFVVERPPCKGTGSGNIDERHPRGAGEEALHEPTTIDCIHERGFYQATKGGPAEWADRTSLP